MPETIQIQFSSVFCKILTPVSAELAERLDKYLSYHPSGYFFSPKYQSGVWDGLIRLYYPKTGSFRSGLLLRVTLFLQELGYEVVVLDKPISTVYKQNSLTYSLRHYQLDAVKEILFKRFGIIKAPPRTGKTHMAIAVVDSERKFPSIIFCRSIDLAYQTVKRFSEFLPDVSVGLIGDGSVTTGDVNVVTIQSAYSAYSKKCPERGLKKERDIENKKVKASVKKLLENAKIVFYDEVQHSQASISKFILDKCISAEMKIGLSATPFNESKDVLIVENVIGSVIYEIGYSDLIKEGFLLRPHIYMYKLPPLQVEGNYQSVYKQAVVENVFLERLLLKIVGKLNSMGKSVVVQTEYIEHTKRLAKILNCDYLTGKEDSGFRQKIIDKLNRGEILCLVSTLFEEGLDLPFLMYTINIAGGLSNIGVLQKMRSITAAEGKTSCGIIDFYHRCKYLQRHSKIRKKLYMREPEFVYEERDAKKVVL